MNKFSIGKDVDYSQWQRTGLPTTKVKFSMPNIEEVDSDPLFSPIVYRQESKFQDRRGTRTSIKTLSSADNSLFQSRDSKYGDNDGKIQQLVGISSPFSTRKIQSACSSLCRHLPRHDLDKEKFVEEEENLELIHTMKFQIKAKKQCLLEYKKQILNLLQDNVNLKKHIQGAEVSCHDGVREQLEKYHKLRGAVENITNEHAKHKSLTERNFAEVKKTTTDELKELEKTVSSLQKEVERTHKHVKTLNNYKNKEYPEKILRIKQLKRELEALSLVQGEDLSEMNHIIEIETTRYKDGSKEDMLKALESAAFRAYDTVDVNVKETSYQNTRLKREIELQKREKARLEIENLELEKKIENLIERIKKMKTALYPGVYQMTEKCMPDTEIELSIPRKQYLPI